MKSTAITEMNNKTIVKLEKAGRIEWVVARNFDDSKPEGQKWDSATYFGTLEEAVRYAGKMDDLYLLTMQADNRESHPVCTIVRSKEEAYGKIREFMTENNMQWGSDKEKKELKDFDYTSIGTFGFFQIEDYTFGDIIDVRED